MKVTLTFDNGPTRETTPHVLNVLERHAIQATFFVLGTQLKDPTLHGLAQQARSRGHSIGNHTYSHSIPFGELDDPMVGIQEIEWTEQLIGEMAGPSRLFRPFGNGGHIDNRLLNKAVVGHLQNRGYTIALWNSIPRDWENINGWPATALAHCESQDWSVVVLHDVDTGAMARLDFFIGELVQRGAVFSQGFPLATTPLLEGRRVGNLDMLCPGGIE